MKDQPELTYGKFATQLMAKQGWVEGSGLGKSNQGMTTAIKPQLKFDTSGVGHDPAKEFKDQWWERAFNKAAKKIQVTEDGKDRVAITQRDRSLKEQQEDKKKEKKQMYSQFVQSATLDGGKLIDNSSSRKKGNMSDSSSDSDEEQATCPGLGFASKAKKRKRKQISEMTDEELFKACGGMTAHKGARHGHRMNGKLARIEAADKIWEENKKMKINAIDKDVELKEKIDYDSSDKFDSKKTKKKKKKTKSAPEESHVTEKSAEVEMTNCQKSEAKGNRKRKKKAKKSDRV